MNKFFSWLIWLIIIAPAIYLAFVWHQLPATVPTHFGLNGQPDKFGNKSELLVACGVLMAMSAIVYLLLSNVHKIDPKKYASENKGRMKRIAFAISVFMTAILFLIIVSTQKGSFKTSPKFIFAGIGVLFSVIGNYMYHLKPNYFAGLRLPWTLENEENWRLTHLLAGKLWFGGGLFAAVLCVFLPTIPSMIALFAVTFTLVIVPVIYSYRLYKKARAT